MADRAGADEIGSFATLYPSDQSARRSPDARVYAAKCARKRRCGKKKRLAPACMLSNALALLTVDRRADAAAAIRVIALLPAMTAGELRDRRAVRCRGRRWRGRLRAANPRSRSAGLATVGPGQSLAAADRRSPRPIGARQFAMACESDRRRCAKTRQPAAMIGCQTYDQWADGTRRNIMRPALALARKSQLFGPGPRSAPRQGESERVRQEMAAIRERPPRLPSARAAPAPCRCADMAVGPRSNGCRRRGRLDEDEDAL